MFCAISGKPAKKPTISLKSNCVFEHSLICQYIDQHGKDPINDQSMSKDDLLVVDQTPQQVALVNSVNSSTLNANYSIPNLLSSLQNEWDAVMLENFTLRKQLDTLTKQLSTAYFERDAAKIVAAEALKEKDDALKDSNNQTIEIPGQFRERLVSESAELAKQKLKSTKFTFNDVSSITENQTWDIDQELTNVNISSYMGKPTKKIVLPSKKDKLIHIAYSADSTVQLPFENDAHYISTSANNDYIFYSDSTNILYMQNTQDNKVSSVQSSNEVIFVGHNDQIASDYVLWATSTGHLAYSKLDGTETYTIRENSPSTIENPYKKVAWHKDGLLVAFYNSQTIEIINITQVGTSTIFNLNKEVPTTKNPIEKVFFSTNGYWLITQTSSITAFDLRKKDCTIISGPLDVSTSQLVDIDASGKIVSTISNQGTLLFYSYTKSQKSWTPQQTKTELNLQDPSSILTSSLLLTDNQLQLLVQTKLNNATFYTLNK